MSQRQDIPTPRRKYESRRRAAQAATTRRRILSAAERLFAEHGFGEATVVAIAREAGVAAPTVYAIYGSKAALLRELLTGLEARVDADGWLARIRGDADPIARLTAFAQWSRRLYSAGRPLIRAAYLASGDPAVQALHDEGNRRRRQWLTALVRPMHKDGALAVGLGIPGAVDRGFVLSSPAVYLACLVDCGWSDDAYERWLTQLLSNQLLRPPAARR